MSRPDSSRTGYPSDYRRPTTNRRSGPAPAPAAEPDQGGDPGVAADIRRSAIDRLMWMNTRHASNAWELRRRDPIAPHGLAMLFAQPDERLAFSHRYRLTAATRLWLAGYDGGGLDHRLFNYHHKIAGELSAPGSDIRDLADKRDPEMADDAVYVGLGVSSLDTSTGTWADLVTTATVPALDRSSRTHVSRAGGSTARVTSEHDIPGCIRILLTDGTTIVAERRGMPEFNHRVIHSTHSLNYTPMDSPYPWGQCTREQLDADPAHTEVLRFMEALNDLFWQTDQAFLVARQPGAQDR